MFNIFMEYSDPKRPIVRWGVDGAGNPVWIYKDELHLPHWKRVHIFQVDPK